MTDVIDYRIYGDDRQVVEIELAPGEGVRAEAGCHHRPKNGLGLEPACYSIVLLIE